jgi:hypothetical protein
MEKQKLEQQMEQEKARKLKELLGDDIECVINTVGHEPPNDFGYNARITNSHAFINRHNGDLTITFNYDLKSQPQPGAWQFLIRMFDVNGHYINHFITFPFAITEEFANNVHYNSGGRIKLKMLEKGTNIIHQTVDMRDASFVTTIEFGIAFR